MTAPLVALTATTKVSDGESRVRLNEAYADAVRAVGLIPLILPPMEPMELAAAIAPARGLVLTGGEDVDPSEYGEPRGEQTEPAHRRRDKAELALVKLARDRRLPTLAICRGLQVVNVALGGTLVQDIPTECPAGTLNHQVKDRAARAHEVQVDDGTTLARTLGTTRLRVNTSHHQSVQRPGSGLRVCARAPDGVIEAAEWAGADWWMVGVQWHPEALVDTDEPWDRALFSAFARRVRGED